MIACELCKRGEPFVTFDGVMYQCRCSQCYEPVEDAGEPSCARGVGETEWDAVQDWVRVCDEILEQDDPGVALNPMWAQLEEQVSAEWQRQALNTWWIARRIETTSHALAIDEAGWNTRTQQVPA